MWFLRGFSNSSLPLPQRSMTSPRPCLSLLIFGRRWRLFYLLQAFDISEHFICPSSSPPDFSKTVLSCTACAVSMSSRGMFPFSCLRGVPEDPFSLLAFWTFQIVPVCSFLVVFNAVLPHPSRWILLPLCLFLSHVPLSASAIISDPCLRGLFVFPFHLTP